MLPGIVLQACNPSTQKAKAHVFEVVNTVSKTKQNKHNMFKKGYSKQKLLCGKWKNPQGKIGKLSLSQIMTLHQILVGPHLILK
jgi:hypothetical protein